MLKINLFPGKENTWIFKRDDTFEEPKIQGDISKKQDKQDKLIFRKHRRYKTE